MHLCFVEAYDSGSHQYFTKSLSLGLESLGGIKIDTVTLAGRHWRSRLQKGHIPLAQKTKELYPSTSQLPDLFIITSLTDSAAFRGLLPDYLRSIPIIQYMHENQMSYPINQDSPSSSLQEVFQKNILPGFHLNQVLAADLFIFNSHYHRQNFSEGLESFLRNHEEKEIIPQFKNKLLQSLVIPIGVDFPPSECLPFANRPKRFLWNHRWEFDKNPKEFAELMENLLQKNPSWEVSLLGESKSNQCFSELQRKCPERIIHFGGFKDRKDYLKALPECRVLPVTSQHDFLGLAILEAMAYGIVPLLPDRLVYPELIPQELHQKLLYSSFDELCSKAAHLIEEGLNPQEEKLLGQNLNQFKWREIINKWQGLLRDLSPR